MINRLYGGLLAENLNMEVAQQFRALGSSNYDVVKMM